MCTDDDKVDPVSLEQFKKSIKEKENRKSQDESKGGNVEGRIPSGKVLPQVPPKPKRRRPISICGLNVWSQHNGDSTNSNHEQTNIFQHEGVLKRSSSIVFSGSREEFSSHIFSSPAKPKKIIHHGTIAHIPHSVGNIKELKEKQNVEALKVAGEDTNNISQQQKEYRKIQEEQKDGMLRESVPDQGDHDQTNLPARYKGEQLDVSSDTNMVHHDALSKESSEAAKDQEGKTCSKIDLIKRQLFSKNSLTIEENKGKPNVAVVFGVSGGGKKQQRSQEQGDNKKTQNESKPRIPNAVESKLVKEQGKIREGNEATEILAESNEKEQVVLEQFRNSGEDDNSLYQQQNEYKNCQGYPQVDAEDRVLNQPLGITHVKPQKKRSVSENPAMEQEQLSLLQRQHSTSDVISGSSQSHSAVTSTKELLPHGNDVSPTKGQSFTEDISKWSMEQYKGKQDVERQIENMAHEIQRKEIEINKLSVIIQSKDCEIQENTEVIASRESDINQCHELNVKLAGDLQNSKNEVREKEEMIATMDRELQNSKFELQEKAIKIGDLERDLQNSKNEVREKKEITATMDRELQDNKLELQEKAIKIEDLKGQLDSIKNDKPWLQLNRCQDWVAPWKIDRSEIRKILKKEIGRGAWGVVYSAAFRGERVAIKEPHPAIVFNGSNTVDLMKREISIMAHIQHPNLVRFIGAVVDKHVDDRRNVPIVVLELLDMDLRAAYTKVSLDKKTMLSIFCDVAYALHYLHEQREPIIHRDISAPNVLLKKLPNCSYGAKVSDFGSANLMDLSKTNAPGAIVYSAPEMYMFQQDISSAPPPQTTKVDVFSYGILLLEVVSKDIPLPEKRHIFLRNLKEKWERIHTLTIRCTNASPADRPAMSDVLNILHQIQP